MVARKLSPVNPRKERRIRARRIRQGEMRPSLSLQPEEEGICGERRSRGRIVRWIVPMLRMQTNLVKPFGEVAMDSTIDLNV